MLLPPAAHAPPSSSAGPESTRKRHREESSAIDANLKRQREIVQEKLREKGIVSLISDLEACKRVGTHGLDLFNELADLLARKLNKRLQDNRALKEELEQLRGTKENLEAANSIVAEQGKLLERLPQAEKDLKEARQRASDAETREESLKARVAELIQADSDHRKRFATASVEGFQMALNITSVLAPGINFKFFNGNYVAQDGKLYEGDRVAYDLAVDTTSEAEEEEETETPAEAAGAGGAETSTA